MLEAVSTIPNETDYANADHRKHSKNRNRPSNIAERPIWTCIFRTPDRGREIARQEMHRPDRRRRNEQPEALISFLRTVILARLHYGTFFMPPKGNQR